MKRPLWAHEQVRTKVLQSFTQAPPELVKRCPYQHLGSIPATDLRFMNGELPRCCSYCRENSRCRMALDLCLRSQQPLILSASSLKHHGKASVAMSKPTSNPLGRTRSQKQQNRKLPGTPRLQVWNSCTAAAGELDRLREANRTLGEALPRINRSKTVSGSARSPITYPRILLCPVLRLLRR